MKACHVTITLSFDGIYFIITNEVCYATKNSSNESALKQT